MTLRAGLINLTINGEVYTCKGAFTYNLGRPRREELMGEDGEVAGFATRPQANFIEGSIQDRGDLDLQTLVTFENATVTLRLANGKTIVQRGASFTGEASVSTENGDIPFRSVGLSCDEVPE